ncbi:DUF4824 family protein [Wenzhouxiangella sp. XN201]|uniref:DUF4824 family protein n=1 Tax=Wenzhouxiangella sp. XN201 TaxID=2710755 RepID=UPI0013C75DDA|nr:DUF4824 family protein [Wenzhouxiangella sp. XN201]NEZ05135.1 DUF4824 family protein [Wenzhouxiangella sp. XN201]
MKFRLPIFAIALVVVVNAFVLAGAAWNRTGEPEAVLELTERELALPYVRGFRQENSGIALSIQLPHQDFDWLDEDKLRTLGVDPDDFGRDRHDRWRQAQRRVHAVLEFDGPAFQRLLEARREEVESKIRAGEGNEAHRDRLRQSVAEMEKSGSRLVVIDAGLDPESLRNRYPDRNRYAVVEAQLSLRTIFRTGKDEPKINSRIGRLLPHRVYVPRRFHAVLEAATASERRRFGEPPSYRVELHWGRRFEPWITDITPLADD